MTLVTEGKAIFYTRMKAAVESIYVHIHEAQNNKSSWL